MTFATRQTLVFVAILGGVEVGSRTSNPRAGTFTFGPPPRRGLLTDSRHLMVGQLGDPEKASASSDAEAPPYAHRTRTRRGLPTGSPAGFGEQAQAPVAVGALLISAAAPRRYRDGER